jgi:integrase
MLLPKPAKVRKAGHFAALPYPQMPDLWAQLSGHTSRTADALRFTILTTARTGEVIAAQWKEIDLEAGIWTVPAERMKAKREHRIPLVPAAVALLEALPRKSAYLFPGLRGNPHLSNMAMLIFLKRDLARPELTVHGFRSAFKDWSMEATSYPGELSEAQLAHVIANKAQAAYERGDKLERRRELLASWNSYLSGERTVTALRKAG